MAKVGPSVAMQRPPGIRWPSPCLCAVRLRPPGAIGDIYAINSLHGIAHSLGVPLTELVAPVCARHPKQVGVPTKLV